VVEDGNGNTFYTRSGRFQRNPDGQLVTHEGEYVLGDGGRVELGNPSTISIDENGQIFADNEVVGTLQVMNFENPTYLHHVGRSLLEATPESGAPQAVAEPEIIGGALERSNVQVVLEMVRMIEANRAFEASGRAVTIQDELSGRMFTSVGRPS
jgi:flagellar basal-body rod protein FlgG